MDQRDAKPAHETKHFPLLRLNGHSDTIFYLIQRDDGVDNGTTLWLAGQVLAMALPALLPARKGTRRRAIELGSGTGYTALTLASMGWDVVATDTRRVIHSVLQKNIDNHQASVRGTVQVLELDWMAHAETHWDNSLSGFDVVLTADTLYVPHLVRPLLHTLRRLVHGPSTLVLVAIERRDGTLLDDAFEQARSEFGFNVQRVPDKKLVKAIQKARCEWLKGDWSGIELWKLVSQV